MNKISSYPFAAVVGQASAKRALMVAIVNPKAGGLLIGGPKGTAKSTLVRGITEILQGREKIDLPLNITEDMLFGSIDIECAVKNGKRKFSPGILARANENFLYIDEVNLLQREMVTAILDCNAAGMNIVERDGISFQHAANYTVVGTMNPEEGTLPAPILDRFGMYAEMVNESALPDRVEIIKRSLAFEENRRNFVGQFGEETAVLAKQIARAQVLIAQIEVAEPILLLAVQMCAQAFCAGHRAEIYLLEAAKAIAALDGRMFILPKDMEEAAQFVLPHRMQNPPQQKQNESESPEQSESEQQDKQDKQEQNQAKDSQTDKEEPDSPMDAPPDHEPGTEREEAADKSSENDAPEQQENQNDLAPEEQTVDIDPDFVLPKMMIDLGKDRNIRRGSGKRSMTRTDSKQGRYVKAAIPKEKSTDLAFDATIRAAAPYQRIRGNNGCAIHIKDEDLRQKVREKRIGNTFLFVVDASGSMGARERMKAVKGAIFGMLQEAYQKRDKVGMIAFRKDGADILLPVTRSVDLAQKCLQQMPTGGKTPLAEGLEAALAVLEKLHKKDKDEEIVLILVTDGRANMAGGQIGDPVERALKVAAKLGETSITGVVIDTESDFIRLGIAKSIAGKMGAACFGLEQLSKEKVLHIVRNTVLHGGIA